MSRARLLGALALAAGLIVFAPASLMEALAQRSDALMLGETSGSFWSGRGVALVAGRRVPLSWRFDPGALLRLRLGLALQVDAPGLKGSARLAARPSSLEIRDCDLTVDGSWLGAAWPALTALAPQGQLRLRTQEAQRIELQAGAALPVNGEFTLNIDRLSLPRWHPGVLGSYALQVQADGERGEFAVSHLSGDLKLEGKGSIAGAPSHSLRFTGHASATRPGTALPGLIAGLGRADANGRVAIDYQGSW